MNVLQMISTTLSLCIVIQCIVIFIQHGVIYVFLVICLCFDLLKLSIFLENNKQYLLDRILLAIREDILQNPFHRKHSDRSYHSYVYKSAHRCRYSKIRHKVRGIRKIFRAERSLLSFSPTEKEELVCLWLPFAEFYLKDL